MKQPRRSDLVINMEILGQVLDAPKGPNHLAQAVNINYGRFSKFAEQLERKNFLRKELRDDGELYFITPEGMEMYHAWSQFWTKWGTETDLR